MKYLKHFEYEKTLFGQTEDYIKVMNILLPKYDFYMKSGSVYAKRKTSDKISPIHDYINKINDDLAQKWQIMNFNYSSLESWTRRNKNIYRIAKDMYKIMDELEKIVDIGLETWLDSKEMGLL